MNIERETWRLLPSELNRTLCTNDDCLIDHWEFESAVGTTDYITSSEHHGGLGVYGTLLQKMLYTRHRPTTLISRKLTQMTRSLVLLYKSSYSLDTVAHHMQSA